MARGSAQGTRAVEDESSPITELLFLTAGAAVVR